VRLLVYARPRPPAQARTATDGGAGMYHFGVVKCLFEQGLLPAVLCGTSIGALVVAMIGATPDASLPDLLTQRTVNFAAFERLSVVGGASVCFLSNL
jgi:predicted acylesterase/phospholipase RssA